MGAIERGEQLERAQDRLEEARAQVVALQAEIAAARKVIEDLKAELATARQISACLDEMVNPDAFLR